MLRPSQAAALFVSASLTIGLSCQSALAGVVAAPAFGSNSARASSWVAGAHGGYNWQRGTLVYGFESDLSAMNLKSSMNGGLSYPFPIVPPVPGDAASTTAKIDWYGTLRGRFGVTTGQALFYGTAGLAYGHVDLNSSFSTLGLTLNSQTSSVKFGWVAGAGFEYLLRPDLSLSLAYQYVDLGTANLAGSTTNFVTIAQTASARAQFQVIMAGLSWRFAPAGSSAAPWEGMYVGGHAGGAWGNAANANYSSSVPVLVSDGRLKRDIELVGRRADGLGIYRYRYLWSDTVYVGVMAQEVALMYPKAVVRDLLNGYLGVDYGQLGMHLMTLGQ
ncbi:outer membrane beta-barrel protein [Bradyrhizobium sp.]|uniref:outer membrane beta-barrel protein n=1 Tax=Bradyrhizobium sp. TaxID=376 RepID=UPI003C707DFD